MEINLASKLNITNYRSLSLSNAKANMAVEKEKSLLLKYFQAQMRKIYLKGMNIKLLHAIKIVQRFDNVESL